MPPDISDLGSEVGAWSPAGVVILGAPVGTEEFVKEHAAKRLEDEEVFLRELIELDDPQCAWQLLSRIALPRGNYWIRTLPPSLSKAYAAQRDDAIWLSALRILRAESLPSAAQASNRRIAELPAKIGGLGLRSTQRTAPAAYWAS